MTPERLIALLRLEPHPNEGGYFRETYRSTAEFVPGAPFPGPRSVGTAIYYLLTADSYSAMHRLPGDEIFHFYLGDPVEMLMLHPGGGSEIAVLGPDLATMTLQHVVPGGVWQGSRLVAAPDGASPEGWALLGTTMAPGFDYRDYEAGTRALVDAYPDRREAIEARLPG